MNQKAVEAAINEFRGPHNRGLRAKLRRAAYEPGSYIPAARVRMLSEVVALDSIGQSRLEAVARAVEAQAPWPECGVYAPARGIICNLPAAHDGPHEEKAPCSEP